MLTLLPRRLPWLSIFTAFLAALQPTLVESDASVACTSEGWPSPPLPFASPPLHPPPLQRAYILPNDAEASAKFSAISTRIPKIPPKGTSTGMTVTWAAYNTDLDPDCWWTMTDCLNPKHQNVPADIASVPEPQTLGYGFDDGPSCSHNAFYDFLKEQNQQATMFYIGSYILNRPLEARKAMTDGHEVCVHSWSHGFLTTMSDEEVFAELWYTMKLIQATCGVIPHCWRPPFGDVDDRVRAIAAALGLRNVMWKYDMFDWEVGSKGVTVDSVNNNYDQVCNAAKNGTFDQRGAIILAHELNDQTMSLAQANYPNLKKAFKSIVPIMAAVNGKRKGPNVGAKPHSATATAAATSGATTASPSGATAASPSVATAASPSGNPATTTAANYVAPSGNATTTATPTTTNSSAQPSTNVLARSKSTTTLFTTMSSPTSTSSPALRVGIPTSSVVWISVMAVAFGPLLMSRWFDHIF